MAGSHVFTSWVAPRITDLTLNKLGVASGMSRAWERDFEREFAVGDTVLVKDKQQYFVNDGFDITNNIQPIDRRFSQIVVDRAKSVAVDWDSIEKALQMERSEEEIEEAILEPMTDFLAQAIDSDAAEFIHDNTPNVEGILGTDPTAFATFDQLRERLFKLGGWEGARRRTLALSPTALGAFRQTAATNAGFYNFQNSGLAKDVRMSFRRGYIDKISDFDVFESMSLARHTVGTWGGTVEVTSAGATGGTNLEPTLTLTCTANDDFNKGDKFSIAAVNEINPMTRQSNNALKQFTVRQDVDPSGTSVTISMWPPIIGPGSPYQNVDALPAAGADLTLWPGTTSPNGLTGANGIAFTDKAFALVGVDLPMPRNEEVQSKYTDPGTGLTFAIIRSFDHLKRSWVQRLDCLYGFGRMTQAANCAVVLGAD